MIEEYYSKKTFEKTHASPTFAHLYMNIVTIIHHHHMLSPVSR